MVEWEYLPPEETTSKNLEMMRERYPDFVLEDKDVLEEDENDANEGHGLKNAQSGATCPTQGRCPSSNGGIIRFS